MSVKLARVGVWACGRLGSRGARKIPAKLSCLCREHRTSAQAYLGTLEPPSTYPHIAQHSGFRVEGRVKKN